MLNPYFVQLALPTRMVVIFLQFVTNHMFDDHDAGVFVSPKDSQMQRPLDSIINFFLGGFRRWDAQYYLHIAEHGYSYENSLAFYPLYPAFIGGITQTLRLALPLDMIVSFRELALVVGVCLNVVFFIKAAEALSRITDYVWTNRDLSDRAVFLFCNNPALIFFTAPYSESLFAWLSFSLMYDCSQKKFYRAMLPLSLSILCRSNGILNLGFFVYYIVQDLMTLPQWWKHMLKLNCAVLVAAVSFGVVQYYQYSLFCQDQDVKHTKVIVNYALQHDLILAGKFSEHNSSWCHQSIPFAYNYVQHHYWDVGFLRYYQLKQIPNFLLAAPIIAVFAYNLFPFFRDQLFSTILTPVYLVYLVRRQRTRDQRLFVFMVHAAVLWLTCVFFVHIQVSTRLLASSSPCLYWFCGITLPKLLRGQRLYWSSFDQMSRYTIIWCLIYCILGTSLFCNFYPWT